MLFFILMSPHFIVVASNCFSGLVLHFVLGKEWIGYIIKRWVLSHQSYLSPLIGPLHLRDGLLLLTMVAEGGSSLKIWRSNMTCAYDLVFFSLPIL